MSILANDDVRDTLARYKVPRRDIARIAESHAALTQLLADARAAVTAADQHAAEARADLAAMTERLRTTRGALRAAEAQRDAAMLECQGARELYNSAMRDLADARAEATAGRDALERCTGENARLSTTIRESGEEYDRVFRAHAEEVARLEQERSEVARAADERIRALTTWLADAVGVIRGLLSASASDRDRSVRFARDLLGDQ